jgi:hypothetical protein
MLSLSLRSFRLVRAGTSAEKKTVEKLMQEMRTWMNKGLRDAVDERYMSFNDQYPAIPGLAIKQIVTMGQKTIF